MHTHPTPGACNVTLGMMNAMVADLCSAQGKTGEGELAQQYGKLGACGFCLGAWWHTKITGRTEETWLWAADPPHACMNEFT